MMKVDRCTCTTPDLLMIPGMGNLCMNCNKWERLPEPKFGTHTYREKYTSRRCEICGEVKTHLLHAGTMKVED